MNRFQCLGMIRMIVAAAAIFTAGPLASADPLELRVVDDQTGVGLPAEVRIQRGFQSVRGGQADAQGRFRSDLPPGPYAVVVGHDAANYLPQAELIRVGNGPAERLFRLRQAERRFAAKVPVQLRVLAGSMRSPSPTPTPAIVQILQNGKPVAGLQTDPRGQATLTLPPGVYEARVTNAADASDRESFLFRLDRRPVTRTIYLGRQARPTAAQRLYRPFDSSR